MANYVIHDGSRTAQGVRPKNEDRFVVDRTQDLFLVADGMGGQERGEQASGMAAEIIPRVLHERLVAKDDTVRAVQDALAEANRAIVLAGKAQAQGRRMGTTAVLAVHHAGQVYVAGLGDSRAYLIRGSRVDQLTVDHSVAQALVKNGVLSADEAAHSPWQNVLHRFLGCPDMIERAEVKPFKPQPGDRLLLASDGLTNFVTEEDLRKGAKQFPVPQAWADHLVELALQRGSRDNVTCVIVAFDRE
jgi:protein phosphatase